MSLIKNDVVQRMLQDYIYTDVTGDWHPDDLELIQTEEGCNELIDRLRADIDFYNQFISQHFSPEDDEGVEERKNEAKQLIRKLLLLHGSDSKVYGEALDDRYDEARYKKFKARIEPLTDALEDFEGEDLKWFYITWNFGYNKEGYITAGVDLRIRSSIADDQKLVDQIHKELENIFAKYDFKLDPSVRINPGKTLFGATHYQIIENNKTIQESVSDTNRTLKESYYKLCWYDSGDGETGIYDDKFNTCAVVKAFDLKDAKEQLEKFIMNTGDEQDRDRIRYFKNFDLYLQDSEMYIDDATEDEYNEYKDYQDALTQHRFESLKESSNMVTIGIYGDEVDGFRNVDALVKFFTNKGIKVSDVDGDMEYGWEMNLTGNPKTLFFAVCPTIPGYNCSSVQDFVDQYRIDESLKEDTVKTKDGKWTNKGDEGTHGKFNTKKEADAQRKAMFANGYKESLKESAAMDTAKKLEDDGWTVLSNGIRGGDTKYYWLARRMNKERGKADWKAIDDETGNIIDISYNQALGREPIGVSSGVSNLSKQLGKMLLPNDESLTEGNYDRPGFEGMYLVCWDDQLGDYHEAKVKASYPQDAIDKVSKRKNVYKIIDCKKIDMFVSSARIRKAEVVESLKESAVWVDGNGKEIKRPMSSFGEPNVDYSLISKQAKDYKEKQNIIRNLIQTYDQVKIQGMSPIVALIRDNDGNTVYRFDFLEKNKDFEDQIAEFKSLVDKGLKESSSSLQKEIYDLLNDMGGYTDYQGRIDAVAEQFGISKDEAEGYVCNWIQFYDEESDMNESLKESYSNFDFINYNDFLANNFDGWSDDIDYLIKDISKCARALKTVSNKLMFYVDYDEDFYAIDDIATVVRYISDDYSLYQLNDLSGINFVFGSDNLWIFKNEKEANHVISSLKEYVNSLNEGIGRLKEGLLDIHDDFEFARECWKKEVPNVDFDDALEQWNKTSKLADPDWFAKPIYNDKAWDDMVQMYSSSNFHKSNLGEDLADPQEVSLSTVKKAGFLEKTLRNKLNEVMIKLGFPKEEVEDYSFIEIRNEYLGDDDLWTAVEVRAEVSYEGLELLKKYLDPIIKKYDKEAYFDFVDAGCMEAYLNLGI